MSSPPSTITSNVVLAGMRAVEVADPVDAEQHRLAVQNEGR
jgi:hypothetical protein